MDQRSGYPTAGASAPPAAAGGNQAIMQFRKALGVPDNQLAPEQKVIDACMGKLGPDLKRMAVAVAGATPMAVPSTPDQAQAGGESAPPDPNSGDTADSPAVQPGSQTQGKMGAATIFGRRPVGTIGDQQTDEGEPDEDDQAPPRASGIFGRRR